MKSIFKEYLEIIGCGEIPEFLKKYLNVPILLRLKNIGYFCGMDYASKDVYDFKEYISRYDHSMSVSLLTWDLTKDKEATIAALFHDVSTPCFSHVIDYMNKDYSNQESTEEYTYEILKSDKYLLDCLEIDNINIKDISDFKKYSIVDSNRPKLCADRLDGIILTGLFWTKDLKIDDVKNIISDVSLFINEFNEEEIGFRSEDIAKFVLEINKNIDIFCHSKEDNYMMELLASITKYAIDKNIINYKDLYLLDELELFNILYSSEDKLILEDLYLFKNIKKESIPDIDLPDVKVRDLNPLVNNKRLVKKN